MVINESAWVPTVNEDVFINAIYRLGREFQGSAETLLTRFFAVLLAHDVPLDWAYASFSPKHPQLKRTVLHWTPQRSSVWGTFCAGRINSWTEPWTVACKAT